MADEGADPFSAPEDGNLTDIAVNATPPATGRQANRRTSTFIPPWYFIVPVVAAFGLLAAFMINKRKTAGSLEEVTNEESDVESLDEVELIDEDPITGQLETDEDADVDLDEIDSKELYEDSIDVDDLDSVVLLDEYDGPPVSAGPATNVVESSLALTNVSEGSNTDTEQLRRENSAARKNLESALTRIAKLKTKLREKLDLISRLLSAKPIIDKAEAEKLSDDELRDHLTALSRKFEATVEDLKTQTDLNRKLKAKLKEKVDLLEALRTVEREPAADKNLEDMNPEEASELFKNLQRENSELKAEVRHLMDWNGKLKSKLRQKIEIIDELSGHESATSSSDQQPPEQSGSASASA